MPSRILSGIIATAVAASAVIAAGAALEFDKVRAGIVADVAGSVGLASIETVERARYQKRKKNASCAEMTAAGFEASRGTLKWHDRSKLEVIAGDDAQVHALIKPGRFEKGDPGRLLSASGSGEFSLFLRNIISGDGEQFQARGVRQTPVGSLAEFGFVVPLLRSRFDYSGIGRVSYQGSLFVAPDSGRLKRLTMLMENEGDACRLEYTIDYTTIKAGVRELLVAQHSVMDELYTDGTELHSDTQYSGYHWPQADAAGPADSSPPKPLPAGLRLKVRLQDPIDGATAAAGDPVTGIVRADVKDKASGAIVVHAGDRVHGRITMLERYLMKYWQVGGVEDAPDPFWDVGIVFESIERGAGQATEQPISLSPVDDGDRTAHDAPLTPSDLQKLRPGGGGYYRFFRKTLLLDQKFESEWETR